MPVPSEAQLANPNNSQNGLTQQQITERITALLAMLTSGQAPDGTPLALAAQTTPGSMIVIGHSYTAGTTLLDSGVSNVFQESVVSRLQGLLHITEDNVLHMGQAGSALTRGSNTIPPNDAFGGWAGVLAFIAPPNSPIAKSTSDPFYQYNACTSPGCALIVHGINDFFTDYNTNITNVASVQAAYAQNAWKNALRGVLSRLRASAVFSSFITPGTGTTVQFDGTLAFSGFGAFGAVGTNTGPAFAFSSTNGNTVTFTIPAEVAGQTIAMAFVGQANSLTYLTSAISTTGQTTAAVANASGFPQTAAFTIRIGSEDMLVTAGTGAGAQTFTVSRGVNGTTPSTYAIGTPVQMSPVHGVTFSGTAANASGFLPLGAQGAAAALNLVVKRFATSAADAGKTIIATVSGVTTSDTKAQITFDSVWAEALNPPPVVLTNLHYFPYNTPGIVGTNVQLQGLVPGFNAATASVVAEFDSKVQVADVSTQFFNIAGTIGTNLNATDTTTNNVPWTCNSSTYTPKVGAIFSFGTTAPEHVQLTAVSGTAPNWTISFTRGYEATASGTVSGAASKFAWPSGSVLMPMDWMSRYDDIHLNSAGHAMYAATLYNAFLALPQPQSLQEQGLRAAAFSEYSQRRSMGPFDNRWYPTSTAVSTTGVPTINKQYWLRIFVPKKSILVGLGVQVAATTTAITERFGIYTNGLNRDQPQRMLQDFGSHATTGTAPFVAGGTGAASSVLPLTGLFQMLNPGTYWVSVAVTVNTGAGTVVTVGAPGPTELLSFSAIPAAASFAPANCYSQTGISGAFADAPVSLGGGSAFGPVSDTTCPLLWYQLRSVNYL